MKNARDLDNSFRLRIMSLTTLFTALTLLLAVTLPQDGFARTTKKKTISITVEQNAACPFGVSVADESWGARQLCVPNYPGGVAGLVSPHIGEKIELEADFVYSGDPKNSIPDAITRVTKVAGHKVNDPCSTGKSILWGIANASKPIGTAGLPPGCAESLNVDASPADNSSASASAPVATVPLNSTPSLSRYTNGLPQCTRTQYVNQGATLWIVNSCNIAVTVAFTSDSGNTWGQVDVNPSNRSAVSTIGMGYSPRNDGTVYLFTCPKGSQPVLPDGNPFLARNYKGQFRCVQQ